MKEKPEEIVVEGKVLDRENRKVAHHGGSVFAGIPKKRSDQHDPGWKKFLTATFLTIRLVKDNDGETLIVITRPKKQEVTE